MTAKQIAEKRYVVKLSDEERERLNTLIRTGKHPARQLTKARILLKADASETGEGWRDCEIAAALDTSVDTVARTRQQLVEEGFDAVLVRLLVAGFQPRPARWNVNGPSKMRGRNVDVAIR